MLNDFTRIVSYEEIILVSNAGSKPNPDYNPTIKIHSIFVDVISKVATSRDCMQRFCTSRGIPFASIGEHALTLRFMTVRDTRAEDEANKYLRSKYPEWEGDWTDEFVGFISGWITAMEYVSFFSLKTCTE